VKLYNTRYLNTTLRETSRRVLLVTAFLYTPTGVATFIEINVYCMKEGAITIFLHLGTTEKEHLLEYICLKDE